MIYRGSGFLAQPLSPPRSRQQVVSLSKSSCVSLVSLMKGEGAEGVGVELNNTTARKPGPLQKVQYSLDIIFMEICIIHF